MAAARLDRATGLFTTLVLLGTLLLSALPVVGQIDPAENPFAEYETADETFAATSRFSGGYVVRDFLEAGFTAAMSLELPRGYPLQTTADKARIKLQRPIDEGWSYKLQTDFFESSFIKDAAFTASPLPRLAITTGKYKVPFSFEEMTSGSRTDFVERSRVVNALAPGREIGLHVDLQLSSRFTGHGGVFDGGDTDIDKGEEHLLYLSRIEFASDRGARRLTAGANLLHDDAIESQGLTVVGGDVRGEVGAFLASGELLYGRQVMSDARYYPHGHQLTLGYGLPADSFQQRILVRWDRFSANRGRRASHRLIIGYNTFPGRRFRLEANYSVPIALPLRNGQVFVWGHVQW